MWQQGTLPYGDDHDLRTTDLVMAQSFWIGVFPGLNERMIEYVPESFGRFFERAS